MCCCVPPLVGCVEIRQRLKGPRENGNFKQRRDLKYLSFCLVKKYGSITDETETGRQAKEMIGCWSGMVGDRLVKADQLFATGKSLSHQLRPFFAAKISVYLTLSYIKGEIYIFPGITSTVVIIERNFFFIS